MSWPLTKVDLSVSVWHSLRMVYSDSNSVVADHTHLEGGQAQEDGHLLEEEPRRDECLLHQGTGGVDLQ